MENGTIYKLNGKTDTPLFILVVSGTGVIHESMGDAEGCIQYATDNNIDFKYT